MENTEQTSLEKILATPIRELGLSIAGSSVEPCVNRLYDELTERKLSKFKPLCYLSDEWGCPSGEPVIGIPFYLANKELSELEKDRNDLEDAREIMMYLRHEAGHAFNYAYKLHRTPEWKSLFGPFRRPYRDNYRPVAFSRDYVRHLPGWYAQKHPDEDFAETFAVWLTPRSAWKQRYRGWKAMAKLRYMDRIARMLGDTDPLRRRGVPDITVDEMELTVGEFYQRSTDGVPVVDLALDEDLETIFNVSKKRRNAQPAADFLARNQKQLTDNIAYWSGVQRPLIRKLVEAMGKKVGELGLRADSQRESEHLTNLSVYATALAMSYLARDKFSHK